MADPQLPDITQELQALPYSNEVKSKLFNAYYAKPGGRDEHVTAILDTLDVPPQLKNSLLDRRQRVLYPEHFSGSSTPPSRPNQPTVAQPQGAPTPQQGSWTDNIASSGANLIKNLGAGVIDAATMGIPRTLQSVKNVASEVASSNRPGLDVALEGGIKEGIAPIAGVVNRAKDIVADPVGTFKKDPVGVTFDIITTLIPAAKAVKGVSKGIKTGAGVMEGLKSEFKPGAAPGPKPEAPPVIESSTPIPTKSAAESAKVFDTPASRLKERKATGNWKAVVKSDKPVEQPNPTSQQTTQKPVSQPSTPQLNAPETQTRLLPEAQKPGNARFNVTPEGTVIDADYKVIETPQGPPQIPAGKQPMQLEAGEQPQRKQLPAAAEPEVLGGEAVDYNKLAAEYKTRPDVVSNFSKLDAGTLEHVVQQAKEIIDRAVRGEPVDPGHLQSASESYRAAQGLLKERSVYNEGYRDSNAYQSSQQVGSVAPENIESVRPPKPAYRNIMAEPVVLQPEEAVQTTKNAKKVSKAPKPQVQGNPVTKAKAASQGEVSKPAAKAEAVPSPQPEPVAPAVTVTESAPVAETVAAPMPTKLSSTPPPKAPKASPIKPPMTQKVEAAPVAQPTPVPAAAKPPVKQAPAAKPVEATQVQAAQPSQPSSWQESPRGKDGRASYREGRNVGSVSLEPDERLFTREGADGLEKYVVKETKGKTVLMDSEGEVISTHPAGTTADQALSSLGGGVKIEPIVSTAKPPSATSSIESLIARQKAGETISRGEILKAKKDAKKASIESNPPPETPRPEYNVSNEKGVKVMKVVTDEAGDYASIHVNKMNPITKMRENVEYPVEKSGDTFFLRDNKRTKLASSNPGEKLADFIKRITMQKGAE